MKFLSMFSLVCALFLVSCEKEDSEKKVTPPEALSIEKTIALPSDEGATDGSIDVTISGGVSPYVFSWSNSEVSEDISDLSFGLYILTVVDAEGSQLIDSTKLFNALEISLVVTNESFEGAADGKISVEISGGLEPFTINWSNDAETKSISKLIAGQYSCQVSDASGNTVTETANVSQLISISLPSSLSYITLYDQSSLRIDDNGTIIYIDPAFVIGNAEDADIIFTTHNHDDHMGDAGLGTSNTIFVSPENVKSNYTNSTDLNFHLAVEDTSFTFGNISVDVVPAYNSWHVRGEAMAVGYVITLSDGTMLYFMGDTGLIPEMGNIDCDIAFVPLGQTYTMASVADAATAVQDCKAEITIPIHYEVYEGKKSDIVELYNILDPKDIEVVVLPKNN